VTKELWVVQITDSHIMQRGGHWYTPATKTAERLIAVVAHINALKPRPDIVIHSGDIVGTDDIAEPYEYAKEILDKLKMPYYVTCGNHDQFDILKAVFKEHLYLPDGLFAHYVLDDLPVRIVVADTTVAHKHFGRLCDDRLKWLEQTLNESTKDVMLFMHHYPIDVQNPLMTLLKLKDSEALAGIISPLKHIKGIYCGHYHHHAAGMFANKLCWISPSTAPSHNIDGDNVLGLNLQPASYSLHHYLDGVVCSNVIQVVDVVGLHIERDDSGHY